MDNGFMLTDFGSNFVRLDYYEDDVPKTVTLDGVFTRKQLALISARMCMTKAGLLRVLQGNEDYKKRQKEEKG